MSIQVLNPKTHEVDTDLVMKNALDEVEKVLPGVYLRFFSFVGKCENLTDLQGEIHLDFLQVKPSLVEDRVYIARVLVDTTQQTLSLEVTDETTHYPSVEHLTLNGKSVKDIAGLLQTYLESLQRCGSTVVLARAETGGAWGVRCGPPDRVFIECLEIDPVSGEVTEPRR